MPGGFNHLSSMYRSLQGPLSDNGPRSQSSGIYIYIFFLFFISILKCKSCFAKERIWDIFTYNNFLLTMKISTKYYTLDEMNRAFAESLGVHLDNTNRETINTQALPNPWARPSTSSKFFRFKKRKELYAHTLVVSLKDYY